MGCHVPKTTWPISQISSPQNASLLTHMLGSPKYDNNSENPKSQPAWMGFLDQILNPFLIFSLPSQSTHTQKCLGLFMIWT